MFHCILSILNGLYAILKYPLNMGYENAPFLPRLGTEVFTPYRLPG